MLIQLEVSFWFGERRPQGLRLLNLHMSSHLSLLKSFLHTSTFFFFHVSSLLLKLDFSFNIVVILYKVFGHRFDLIQIDHWPILLEKVDLDLDFLIGFAESRRSESDEFLPLLFSHITCDLLFWWFINNMLFYSFIDKHLLDAILLYSMHKCRLSLLDEIFEACALKPSSLEHLFTLVLWNDAFKVFQIMFGIMIFRFWSLRNHVILFLITLLAGTSPITLWKDVDVLAVSTPIVFLNSSWKI